VPEDAVEVRPSPIAGRGLFAATELAPGQVVVRVVGDAGHPDSLGTAFPNHSCDPNLGWADADTLVTLAAVTAGEELVVDYAMSVTDPSWFLRCHCPSYRCRQMIEGTDWRIRQLQQRYAGWWAPCVQELLDVQTEA